MKPSNYEIPVFSPTKLYPANVEPNVSPARGTTYFPTATAEKL
jgi:hypothetical protein